MSLYDFGPVNGSSNMFGKYCRYLQAQDGAEAQSQVTWACFLLANDPHWFINYGDSFLKPSSPSLEGCFNFELPVCFWSDWLTSYQAGSKKLASLMITVED